MSYFQTVFGRIKQESALTKFGGDGFKAGNFETKNYSSHAPSTFNKENSNLGMNVAGVSGVSPAPEGKQNDMDQYKSFNKTYLPAQQKEEGFSMNEHDFENLNMMIKPVKYEAL